MLTPEGGIKILDFGIAKLDYAVSKDNQGRPPAITNAGLIIGTPGYMAPEQIIGKPVDARSDIFALGIVLYEMLSGTRAFKAASAVEMMNSTLKEEPPDLPVSIPAPVQRIMRRCLAKAKTQRFQSAADVGFALAAVSTAGVSTDPTAPVKHRNLSKRTIAAAVAAILIGSAGYWAGLRRNRGTRHADYVLRHLTADSGLTTDGAISPDGKLVAFASDRTNTHNLEIWVKQLSGAGAAVRLTNDAADDYDPAFTPDGTQSRIVPSWKAAEFTLFRRSGATLTF